MAGFDIFANVKNFLEKADDDSIDYSAVEIDDTEQPVITKKSKGKKRKNQDEDSPELIQPKSRNRTTKRVLAGDSDDEFGAAAGSDDNENVDLAEEEAESLSGSDSDSDVGDIYEAPVSKYTDPKVLDEINATVAAATTRGRGRGRRSVVTRAAAKGKTTTASRGRRGRKGATTAPLTSTLSLEQAMNLAFNYSPSLGVQNKKQSGKKNQSRAAVLTARIGVDSPILIDSGPSSPAVPPATPSNHNVIETVDMTGGITPPSTPVPMFQKNVTVDLDNESSDDMDDSYDLDIIRVKVKFKSDIQLHKMRSHQKFADVMKKIALKENCKVENVFLELNGKVIHRDDTPHSIDYKITKFLTARIMNMSTSDLNAASSDKNIIEVKFQSDKWRKPVLLKISKVECFETALEKLSEEISHNPKKIMMTFDGDSVDLRSTPEDEGFEGGECIDCKLL